MAKHPRRQRRELDRLRRQQLARRRARAAAAAGGDLALEQLESRQLLAITVTKDTLASYKVGADYVFTDPTSIEISKNLVIDAGGGKISLTAPVITIGDGAQLLSKGTGGAADGAITLTARDASTRTGISPADFLFEVVSGFARDTATITIGAKATLAGGTIQIDAFAGNDRPTFSNDPVSAAASRLPGAFLTAINDLVALPLTGSSERDRAALQVITSGLESHAIRNRDAAAYRYRASRVSKDERRRALRFARTGAAGVCRPSRASRRPRAASAAARDCRPISAAGNWVGVQQRTGKSERALQTGGSGRSLGSPAVQSKLH